MARADDPFIAWLCQLTGPLSRHQSRLVLGALIDRLRVGSSPEVRLGWHRAFRRWWSPTVLSEDGFEDTMQRVRQPPTRGRRPAPPNQIRARYNTLIDLADLLRARTPSRTEFRREIENWQRIGVLPARRGPLPLVRLYDLRDNPARLALALLHATTGKSVKFIRRQIKDPAPRALPAP
jgi:hypothetical protein